MKHAVWCMLLVVTACGAASTEQAPPAQPPTVIGFVSSTVSDTASGVWGTVEAPFEDVGIKQEEIPAALQRIMANPYAMPNPLRCETLRKEIAELDAVLGPDVCTVADPNGTGNGSGYYLQQGSGIIRDNATSIVGGRIALPFRGIVRRVSGADKHAKEVAKAYQNGKLRRAFLKGIGMTMIPPCAPLPVVSPAPER